MSGRTSSLLTLILLLVTAPLAALALWVLVGLQLRPADTLNMRFQTDSATFGTITWPDAEATAQAGTTISYRGGAQHTTSSYPISITFDPIPSKNPASQGNQVWIFGVLTDQQMPPDWKTYKELPSPWRAEFDSGISKLEAAMFPGEPPTPLTLQMTTTNGLVSITALSHPWSGGVRVTINGLSREFDLYGEAGVVKQLQMSVPNLSDMMSLDVPGIPGDQTTLRWNMADRPGSFNISSLRIDGARQWEWRAGGDLPRMGVGVKVITNTVEGLLVHVDDPDNAWIEFTALPAASRFPVTPLDLLTVAAVAGCIWFGMLLLYLGKALARVRRPWSAAGLGAVPLAFLSVVVFLPLVQSNKLPIDEKTRFTAELVLEELDYPDGITFAPDGRMFVIEKGGFEDTPSTARVKLVRPNSQTADTVLELPVCANIERGLLGIALDPNFMTNGHLYLYYTRQGDNCRVDKATPTSPRNRVSRFTFAGDKIDARSELVLVDDIPSVTSAHNAGTLRFGPDGLLYVSTGEGAIGNNSQDLSSLGGKILRLNPDPSNLVPPDNPFVTDEDPAKRLIWAYGFRNPFRFNIHPRTGMLLAGDVGSAPPHAREEINLVQRGGNYGWPKVEGIVSPPQPEFVQPLYAYEHDNACNTIIGGVFVTSDVYPAKYRDNYIFGDFSCGRIWRMELDRDGTVRSVAELLHNAGQHPVDFAQGPDGYVYYVDIFGKVWRLKYMS